MRRSFLPLMALVLMVTLGACASPSSVPKMPNGQSAGETTPKATKEELNNQAFTAMQQKNWTQAIELARQAVALDPEYAQAQFNLGLALYRSGAYSEAKPHLEKAYAMNKEQVEPGWFLALTLEQTRDQAGAVAILKQLQSRFPADADVAAALKRMGPIRWQSSPSRPVLFLGDRLLALGGDGAGIELRDAADQVTWSAPLAGQVKSWQFDQGSNRVIVMLSGGGMQLIDPERRQVREVAGLPVPIDKDSWNWSGDLVYFGHDIWTTTPSGSGKYSSTAYKAFRLREQSGKVVAEPVPGAAGGQFIRLSPDGRTAVLGEDRANSSLVLYRDGRKVRIVPARDPAEFTATGHLVAWDQKANTLLVESVDGEKLLTRPLPAGFWGLARIPRTDGDWMLLRGSEQYAILRGDDQRLVTGTGYAEIVGARHVILRKLPGVSKDNVFQVRDFDGNLVAEYPGRNATVSRDGNWLYIYVEGGIEGYRLP